jgi:prepilin-type N-terminal cleavage/methylation domain-containing protein
MNQMSQTRTHGQSAFTIVELLIVIVVIAILATISIMAYNGIQDRANDTAVQADISAIIKKFELARIDLGHYPQSLAEFPDGFKFSKAAYDPTQNNIYYCDDKVNDLYAFGLRSKSLKGYILSMGTTTAGVGISAAATCSAISKTWANDATTFVAQGYGGPPSSAWVTSWNWTK